MERSNKAATRSRAGGAVKDTMLINPSDSEAPAGSPQSSIGFQMRKTYRMIEMFIQERLAGHDIQVGMWYFLRTLWIEDGLTQRELANRVGATEPTALEQLRKMEARGLIKRRRDAADKRKSTVLLTAEGKRLKGSILPYVDELNAAAFSDFEDQERKLLEQYLARIRRNLHRLRQSTPC